MSTTAEGERTDVILYWIQGSANCTRLKGYLKDRGVDFRPVNVMDDLEAVDAMRDLGILSMPVIRVGDRWANGIDLKAVDDLLGFTPDPKGRPLTLAELIDRASRLLQTAAELAQQIPADHQDDPTPTMENYHGEFLNFRDGSPYIPHGTFKSLVHHIAGHGVKFKRLAMSSEGVYPLGFAIQLNGDDAGYGEPEASTPMYRVVDDMNLTAQDIRAWHSEHQNADLTAVIDTFYGPQTVHQLLQTNVCSLAQHTRQLTEVVESRLRLEPKSRVQSDDLEGLLMPAGIWQ